MAAELLLYGECGADGFSAAMVRERLAAAGGEPVDVRINSHGGDVFEAIAIHGALRDYAGKVTVYVDALAASAASVIAMAGREIIMAAGSYMMVHLPHVSLTGRAEDLRRHATTLDDIGGTLARIYANRTNASLETVNEWLAEERWFSAAEAVEAGFGDRVEGEAALPAIAASALSGFKNVPQRVMAMAEKADGPCEAPAEARARERIAAILDSDEAAGRDGLARFIALKTTLPVADAKAALAAAPRAASDTAETPESYERRRLAERGEGGARAFAMPSLQPRPRPRSFDEVLRGVNHGD